MSARTRNLGLAVAAASLVVVGLAWRAKHGADQARTDLAVCMAGREPPRSGTRLDRVDRVAYVKAVRRDPRFAELGAPPEGSLDEGSSDWPFRCAGAAGEVERSTWLRTLEPSLHAAAAELETALGSGFLPRHLDGRLFEQTSVRDTDASTELEVDALDPLLDEDALHRSRTALPRTIGLTSSRRTDGEPGRVWLDAGDGHACVIEDADGRPLGRVRCGVDAPASTDATVELLGGGPSPALMRCPFVGGAVSVFRKETEAGDAPFEVVFEENGKAARPLEVARGPREETAANGRWGAAELTCAPGIARLTWVRSSGTSIFDMHDLRRAVCTPRACALDSVQVDGLTSPLRREAVSSYSTAPSSLKPPHLVDLGERAWLIWELPRAVAVRSAPFAELAAAPTRTLVATYSGSGGLPPFLSAIALQYGTSIVDARDGVALFVMSEGVGRLDGSRAGAAFLVRLDAGGTASLLVPDSTR